MAGIPELSNRECLTGSANPHLRIRKRIQKIGILQINLVRSGKFAYAFRVGIQQIEDSGIGKMPEILHHCVPADSDRSGQLAGIQLVGYVPCNDTDKSFDLSQIGDFDFSEQRQFHIYHEVDYLTYLDVIVRRPLHIKWEIAIRKILLEEADRSAHRVHLGA